MGTFFFPFTFFPFPCLSHLGGLTLLGNISDTLHLPCSYFSPCPSIPLGTHLIQPVHLAGSPHKWLPAMPHLVDALSGYPQPRQRWSQMTPCLATPRKCSWLGWKSLPVAPTGAGGGGTTWHTRPPITVVARLCSKLHLSFALPTDMPKAVTARPHSWTNRG